MRALSRKSWPPLSTPVTVARTLFEELWDGCGSRVVDDFEVTAIQAPRLRASKDRKSATQP